MGENYTVRQEAKRIELLSVIAAVLAYPAAIGFVLLWLIEQHGGLLGFALIWLLGVGVSIRVYAQFLRLWHGVGYPPAAVEGATVAPPRTLTVPAGPASAMPVAIEATELRGSDERALVPTSPRPASPIEVTGLSRSAEPSPDLTNPRRAGTDSESDEAKEWREALRKEWARAEAKLGTTNPGVEGVGKRPIAAE